MGGVAGSGGEKRIRPSELRLDIRLRGIVKSRSTHSYLPKTDSIRLMEVPRIP